MMINADYEIQLENGLQYFYNSVDRTIDIAIKEGKTHIGHILYKGAIIGYLKGVRYDPYTINLMVDVDTAFEVSMDVNYKGFIPLGGTKGWKRIKYINDLDLYVLYNFKQSQYINSGMQGYLIKENIL